jgi:hypothetical protein
MTYVTGEELDLRRVAREKHHQGEAPGPAMEGDFGADRDRVNVTLTTESCSSRAGTAAASYQQLLTAWRL